MNILLTNNRIKDYTGSEIDTANIANYFISLNHNVDIFTLEYGNPLLKHLNEKVRIIGYENADILLDNYDLIWSHHFPLLDYILFSKKIKAKYINYSCLSSYEPYEMPPLYYKFLTSVTYLSKETIDCFKKQNIDMKNFSFFPNYVYDEYFKNIKTINKLKKICIVSNHIPQELKEAKKIFENNKYSVDIYGLGYTETMINADILNKYDLVISIGKTVNYALGLGIPVFCYDHFGGDLYITKENIKDSFNFNFSGRYKKIKLNANKIYNYIINNYKDALLSVDYNKKFMMKNCSFENNIAYLLKKILKSNRVNYEKLYKNYNILNYYSELYLREITNRIKIINELQNCNNKLNNINKELLSVCDERLRIINELQGDK
jgi:hypothetical protein